MSKKVPLIIRQVKNVWQVLLPGGILLATFKNKREALAFNITDEDKETILSRIKKKQEDKALVNEAVVESSPAIIDVKPDVLKLPEGLKQKANPGPTIAQLRRKINRDIPVHLQKGKK